MTAQAFSDIVLDLATAAEVVASRHGEDSSFVAARMGERTASVDIFWDDGLEIANVCIGDGADVNELVSFSTPGLELGREVIRLLREDGAR